METKENFTKEVKAFFEKPELYLSNQYGRNIRRDILEELLEGKEFDTLIDIGCGDGSLSYPFLGKSSQITLADISASMLNLAKQKLAGRHGTVLSFVEGNFTEKDMPSKEYELVLCIGVLAHVADLGKALNKLFSLVKPGGRVAIQFSDYNNIMTKAQLSLLKKTYKMNHITLEMIQNMATDAGFEIERKQKFGIFFPGIGKLPGKFVYQMQRIVYKSQLLSQLGADYILVLRQKNG